MKFAALNTAAAAAMLTIAHALLRSNFPFSAADIDNRCQASTSKRKKTREDEKTTDRI